MILSPLKVLRACCPLNTVRFQRLIRFQSTSGIESETEDFEEDGFYSADEEVEFHENPFLEDKALFYTRNLNVSEVHRRFRPPRQCWVHSFTDFSKRGLVELHPNVFASNPRTDLIYDVIKWQEACVKETKMEYNRSELPGSGNKQLPQKGSGKARRKGERAPHFIYGGKANPSRPYDYGYDIDLWVLANGFTALLTIKLAQGDLYILDSLSNFSVSDLKRLKSSLKTESALFVTGYEGLNDDQNEEICFTPDIDLLTTETVHPMAILDNVSLVMDYKAVVQLEEWSLSMLGHDTTLAVELTEVAL